MHVFFGGGEGLQIYKQTAMQALAKTQIHEIMVRKKYKKMLHQHPQTLGFGLRYFSAFKFLLDLFPLIICVYNSYRYIRMNLQNMCEHFQASGKPFDLCTILELERTYLYVKTSNSGIGKNLFVCQDQHLQIC